jgi:hypothetical protein
MSVYYYGLLQRSNLSDGDISEFFDLLGVGVVLQGDTLAPYLFVIVIDWVPHNALPDPSLGFFTRPREDTRNRCNSPHLHVTDLDFAVGIASSCLSSSAANMQSMVLSIEHKVGLKIDQWSQDRIYALWLQYSLAGFVVFL